MVEKAVVLLSGGLDSAVTLWWARARRWRLYTLTVNFNRRNPCEIEAAQRIAEAACVEEHRVIDMPFLREAVDGGLTPDNPILQKPDLPPAYIPARNILFYAAAAWWAETLSAEWIVGGHNSIDFKDYPDSTPEFFRAFNRVLKIGTWTGRMSSVKVLTPLSNLGKLEIVRLAVELNVPIELTWSCHGRGDRACGVCPACTARLEAFREAGLTDPVEYAVRASR